MNDSMAFNDQWFDDIKKINFPKKNYPEYINYKQEQDPPCYVEGVQMTTRGQIMPALL